MASASIQGNIPEHLASRLLSSDRRKQRQSDIESQALASQAAATQALLAATMQGYPMNLAAFNSMAAMGELRAPHSQSVNLTHSVPKSHPIAFTHLWISPRGINLTNDATRSP